MTPLARRHTHFDRIAHAYNETIPAHVREHYLRRRVTLVREHLPSGCIVDAGCGTGTLMAALAAAGLRPLGVDDSLAMLEQQPDSGRGRVAQGLAHQLPLRDASVDGAICVATLHHLIDRAAVTATIRDMVRVTRSGGVVILWDHNPLNPYWPIFMRRLPQDAGGYRLVPLRFILRAARTIPSVARIQAIRTGGIPDFVPAAWLPLMARVEHWWESTPILRNFLAHNVVILHVRRAP